METLRHAALKHEAARWLVRAGCCAAGIEVKCPIARHRVDAAGYLDPLPKGARNPFDASGIWERKDSNAKSPGLDPKIERGPSARSVIIECKQARSDFLVDSRDVEELLSERERLQRVRCVLEEQIVKVCEPQLRKSGSRLFSELEEWDFNRSRVASYRGVLSDLRRIDERLHGESKFWTLAHYRLADWLYLAAPMGVVRPHEVPPGWGLLEMPRGWDPDVENGSGFGLGVRLVAPELTGKPDHRQRLLRNIAVAATRRVLESGRSQVEAE